MKNITKCFYFRQWFSGVFSEYRDHKKWITMIQRVLYCFLVCNSFDYFAPCEEQYCIKYACNKIRYAVTLSAIPWAKIADIYNRWATRFAKEIAWYVGSSIILIIDDTFTVKDKRSKRIIKGGKKRCQTGYSYVTSLLVIGSIQIPLMTTIAIRKEICEEKGIEYISKIDALIGLIDLVYQQDMSLYKVIVMFDSWYSSTRVIKKVLDCGFTVIGAIKSNRKVNRNRISSVHFPVRMILTKEQFKYGLATMTGTLCGLDNQFKVLSSIRTTLENGKKTERYIISSDLTLTPTEILFLYKKRWLIEVFHQVWKKRLNLEKLQVYSSDTKKSMEKQMKVLTASILAMGFACYYAQRNSWNELFVQKVNSDALILDVALNKIRETLISQKTMSQNVDCKFS